MQFLSELEEEVESVSTPIVMGGNFNLIHENADKSEHLLRVWGAKRGRDARLFKADMLQEI